MIVLYFSLVNMVLSFVPIVGEWVERIFEFHKKWRKAQNEEHRSGLTTTQTFEMSQNGNNNNNNNKKFLDHRHRNQHHPSSPRGSSSSTSAAVSLSEMLLGEIRVLN